MGNPDWPSDSWSLSSVDLGESSGQHKYIPSSEVGGFRDHLESKP
jgi:hypothetical protein